MVQKRETKALNKLCVREILSSSFVCGAYFFEFRGRNLVCFGIAYNFDWGRHMQIRAEAGKARMRTAFFTRVQFRCYKMLCYVMLCYVRTSSLADIQALDLL